MDRLQELIEKRNKVWEVQKQLNDKATAEKRDFSADETITWENADKDFASLTKEIDELKTGIKKAEERSAQLAKREAELEQSLSRPPERNTTPHRQDEKETELRAFERLLRGDSYSYRQYIEKRTTQQVDNDPQAGYLVPPEQFINQLIKNVDNMVFVRNFATKYSLPTADSLGAPVLDADPADANWTSELKTGSEDSSMRFEKRALHPHPLAKRIKVSKTLVRKVPGIVNLINERLAYKFAVTQEQAFLTGTGAQQPLGVMTASNNGISTGRDVSTGNTTTNIAADNLIECKYTLKPQYRGKARWLFHRDGIKRIRKLKDGEGQYLWRAGIAGTPDTILDMPFDESEYMSNTWTTGLYVGILADWSGYWIIDTLGFQMQVLTELYAESNTNGYIGRMELDGAPVLEEAFVRVKLA